MKYFETFQSHLYIYRGIFVSRFPNAITLHLTKVVFHVH